MRLAPSFAVVLAGGLVPALAAAEPPLHLPWTCDDVYQVTNGHNTSSHTGKDAHAWDFGLPVGTTVRAPADGVVRLIKMDSSQGGCDGAYANDANYVVVDFGDGTEALLMHLQHASSDLHVGDVVHQGDVVGKVGLTGWVCGAHLHFQIQSTCDSWWCQSQPAAFVDFGDPDEGVPLESNNCPVAEPCSAALDGATTVIDDADARCFTRISSWFWPGDGGWNDGHIYTWANDGAEPDTVGRWDFDLALPGRYRLEAYVPDTQAGSQQARYEIHTGAQVIALPPIDQSTHKGWVDLGAHELVAGDEHWVRLADNTGEPRDLDRELAFDAIRWRWDPEASGTEGGGSTDGADGDAPGTSEGGEVTADGQPATGDAADDGGPSLPPSADDTERSAGCSTAAPRGALAFMLPVLVAFGRRRSRSRRTEP